MKRLDGLAIGIVGATAALTALVYERLPERLATHFDLDGNPNGWMPRAIGAWFVPIFALAIFAVVRFSTRKTPRAAILSLVMAAFMSAVHVLILAYALVPQMSIMRPLWALLGVLFIVLGLVLPRVKRNAWVGIRTPWSLSSDETWSRTQRFGGYAMVLGGVVTLVTGIMGCNASALVAVLASSIVPVVYSAIVARRANRDA